MYGGYTHYLKVRRIRARIRQGQILAAMKRGEVDFCGGREVGIRELAIHLRVSERTVWRDIAVLRASGGGSHCPLCGQALPTKK